MPQKEYIIIEKTKLILVKTPTTLTEHIVPPAPPTKNYVEMKGATELEREQKRNDLLTDYAGSLLQVGINLNKRLDSIVEYNKKNQELVDKQNKDEDERVQLLIENKKKELKNEN